MRLQPEPLLRDVEREHALKQNNDDLKGYPVSLQVSG